MIGGRWPDRRALVNSIPLLQRLALSTRPEPTEAASESCRRMYLEATGQLPPPPPGGTALPPSPPPPLPRWAWIAVAIGILTLVSASLLEARFHRQAVAPEKYGQAWMDGHTARMEALIAAHQVAVSMDAAEVLRSWGQPAQRVRLAGLSPSGAQQERWVYPQGDVYLEDGVVSLTDLW